MPIITKDLTGRKSTLNLDLKKEKKLHSDENDPLFVKRGRKHVKLGVWSHVFSS